MSTQLVAYIITTTTRGVGDSADDPIREVRQLWTYDGKLIAEHDMWTDESWWSGALGDKP